MTEDMKIERMMFKVKASMPKRERIEDAVDEIKELLATGGGPLVYVPTAEIEDRDN